MVDCGPAVLQNLLVLLLFLFSCGLEFLPFGVFCQTLESHGDRSVALLGETVEPLDESLGGNKVNVTSLVDCYPVDISQVVRKVDEVQFCPQDVQIPYIEHVHALA
jgi:hypothetical protein